MPAWPGGPCPECGDQMPARLIRCATCRALLNSELVPREIEYPDFVPLREVLAVVDAPVKGDFIKCPQCTRELRISLKFRGKKVSCRHCSHAFRLQIGTPEVTRLGVYAPCPHCKQELRASERYISMNVSCKFCNGAIRIVDQPPSV
jgi:hypothetical protein